MQAAILGKKIGMTQVYDEAGNIHPVTVVQAGPCHVLQVKNAQTDGYEAVQIGYEDVVRPSRTLAMPRRHGSARPRTSFARFASLHRPTLKPVLR